MTIEGPQFPVDARQVVRGVDEKGNLAFSQVGVEELNYRGRFGAVAASSTENTVAIGEHAFVIDDFENRFRIGDDVLATCLDDPTSCFMWGEIIAKGGTSPTAELTVYVDDLSDAVRISSNWELQVVARPKFGITKDTSTTSVDPTAAGPFTITVTAGKFFPIGGKLLMIPLAARQIALVGLVKAYSGNSLVVEKNSTNATVSTSYTAWAIALLDAPQNAIPFYQINGLRVKVNATDPAHDIDISAGSVRDWTNTVDLVLSSNITKRLDATFAAGTNQGSQVQSANLAGTVTSAALNVTGTGTAFLSNFGLGPSLSDLDNQLAVLGGPLPFTPSVITAGVVTRAITVTTNADGTTESNLSATASTYKRGGWIATNSVGYAVILARKDSDGSTDVFTCALNGSGSPDLPSGYTYYRVLGLATSDGAGTLNVTQYLTGINALLASEVRFSDLVGSPFFVGGLPVETVEAAIQNLESTSTLDHGPRIAAIEQDLTTDGLVVVGLRSQTFTLADNTATSFVPPASIINVSYSTGNPAATAPSGIIAANVGAATAPVEMAVTDATNVTYAATSLVGTTGGAGTVGKLTFGSNGSGSLFIQNRLGASRTIRLTVLTY